MTFFQIGTSVFRPVAGYLVDEKQKRRLLLGSLVLFFLVMAAFNAADCVEALYGLRLVHGIVFALATTTAASIAVLVIPPSRRGEGIGYFSVTTNMAMVVGPLAGLLLYQTLRISGLFLALAVLAALILAAASAISLPPKAVQPSPSASKTPFFEHFIEKRSLLASFLGGLVFFAYGGILTFIPLYAASLHMAESTGLFFAVFAVVIVASRPVVGNVLDRVGPSHVVYPASPYLSSALFSSVLSVRSCGFSCRRLSSVSASALSVPYFRHWPFKAFLPAGPAPLRPRTFGSWISSSAWPP